MGQKNYCLGCFNTKDDSPKCKICGYLHSSNENPDSPCLAPGTILNERYIIGKVLGTGGFGITYIAYDPKLEVRLAIKEFFPRQIASRNSKTMEITPFDDSEKEDFESGLKYFLHEVRSAAMFETHQNIVGVKDFFEENSTAYMVMPYISGTPFDSFLATKGGNINFGMTLSILAPIMDAVVTMHDKNLLHRDISPENIFITNEGVPKLLDFGSARPVIASTTLSMTPVIKEGYAPLEQYSRQGEQGPWTDVYSMAATIYKAVSGNPPPPAMERFSDDTLAELAKICPDMPGYAEKALIKALSLRSSDRFQSMADFLNALTKGKTVEPLKLEEQTETKSKKKTLILALVIVGALLFTIAFAFFSPLLKKSGLPKEAEVKSKQVDKLDKKEETENLAENKLSNVEPSKKETETTPPAGKVNSSSKKPAKATGKTAKKKQESKQKTVEATEQKQVEKKKDTGVTIGGSGNFVIPGDIEKGLTPEEYFKSGFKYELARNNAQAIAYYQEACLKNFSNGCYRLGKIKKDSELLSKARTLYQAECKKRKSSSCIALAEMMLKGEGGNSAPSEAITMLAKECSTNKVEGCFLLASIWEKGENIEKDLGKARKYYKQSCDSNSREGCFKYAEMLENGLGGTVDAENAVEYYSKACQKGLLKACIKAKKQ
ncbi:MAG: protein kinase domain-containing protein [bacterium]